MDAERRTVRILLVDDHVLFREGAARLLAAESGFGIVAHCGSIEEALNALASKPIDLVLLDLDLGKQRGFDFFRPAREVGFHGPIVIVAAVVSPFEMRRLVYMGAAGICLKQSSPALLVESLRGVMAGELRIDPTLQDLAVSPAEGKNADRLLDEREREVLMGVFEGLANKEIAARVHISEASVKATLQQLFDKNGVRTRSQLVRIVLEQYSQQL
ncbi:MAG TPA: response regulator transcription factor [Terriglobales bacterium]|nr:response regulator transcription factor [Terriglobales bacterium]